MTCMIAIIMKANNLLIDAWFHAEEAEEQGSQNLILKDIFSFSSNAVSPRTLREITNLNRKIYEYALR